MYREINQKYTLWHVFVTYSMEGRGESLSKTESYKTSPEFNSELFPRNILDIFRMLI